MSTLIPLTRPVIGEDLDTVRDQMGLSTSEACWLFGLSMTKWMEVAKEGAKTPVKKPTLAMLVRVLNKRPDLTLMPVHPTAHEVFARMHQVDPELDKKRLSVYFGSEASSGYRWITKDSDISPALARLFLVFTRLFDRAIKQGPVAATRMMEEWRLMVESEAAERGIANIMHTGRWKPAPDAKIGRPILGEDLDSLREQLGMSTMDACWLYGLSMTKWTLIAKRNLAKEPLKNVTLALLVRVLRAYPEVSPVMPAPTAKDVFAAILESQPALDRKRMAIMFGCEASSGYRWLTTDSEIGPALVRLFKMFMLFHGEVITSPKKKAELVAEWDEMVNTEARARGVRNVFSTGRWVPVAEKPESERRQADPARAQQMRAARAAKKNKPVLPQQMVPEQSVAKQAVVPLDAGEEKVVPRKAGRKPKGASAATAA